MQSQPKVAFYTIDSYLGYLDIVKNLGLMKSPASPLYLPIYLRMVGRTHKQVGAQKILQFL